jgi:hypothetical protein
VAGIVGVLCVPGSAGAAQVIGQTGPPSGCATNQPFLQQSVSSGTDYVATSYGVITSWSAQAANSTGGQTQLLVLRQVAGDVFKVVQKDIIRTLTQANVVNIFPGQQILIYPGDRIGNFVPAQGGTAPCIFTVASDPGNRSTFPGAGTGEPSLGSDIDFDNSQPTFRTNISAVVEPDADCNGRGDETQGAATRKCLADVLSAKAAGKNLRLTVSCPLVTQPCSNNQVVVKTAKPISLSAGATAAKGKRVALGSTTISLAAGATQTFVTKLTKSARALFAGRSKVTAKAIVSGAGLSATESLKVKRKSP